jgi:hypothetical protein
MRRLLLPLWEKVRRLGNKKTGIHSRMILNP